MSLAVTEAIGAFLESILKFRASDKVWCTTALSEPVPRDGEVEFLSIEPFIGCRTPLCKKVGLVGVDIAEHTVPFHQRNGQW